MVDMLKSDKIKEEILKEINFKPIDNFLEGYNMDKAIDLAISLTKKECEKEWIQKLREKKLLHIIDGSHCLIDARKTIEICAENNIFAEIKKFFTDMNWGCDYDYQSFKHWLENLEKQKGV